MNQCSGKGTAASFVFFAARGGTRWSKDKVGGVGSHDLNYSPTKWPISGPGSRGENSQLNDKFFFMINFEEFFFLN